MKKTKLSRIISIAVLLSCLTVFSFVMILPASASDEYKDGNYTYTVTNGKATVVNFGNKKIKGEVIIPSTLGGYPVIRIDDSAFCGCEKITKIDLPNTITSIGNFAFKKCSALEQIELPESIKSIGNGCFSECISLEGIIIPSGLTEISAAVFSQCTSLKNVTISSGVEKIVSSAFAGCSNLEKVHIPSSVKEIGISSFPHCPAIADISVDPENQLFHSSGDCLIKTDSKTLLLGCKESIIPSDGSVTSISPWAFEGCSELKSIDITKTVTTIGYGAFGSCSNLSVVNIPQSVTKIEERVFEKCANLSEINIAESNTDYHTYSDCVIETKSKTLIYGGKNGQIPTDGSVTCIGSYAFSFNSSIGSFRIPSSISDISPYAFYHCSNLSTVTFSEGSRLKTLDSFVFNNCEKLTSVSFEKNSQLEYINSYAFNYCKKIKSITIPKGTKRNSDIFVGYESATAPKIYYNQSNSSDNSDGNSGNNTSSGCASNIFNGKAILLTVTVFTFAIFVKKGKPENRKFI